MKKSTVGILAAVAALGFAQVAEAQVCAGFPSSERGFYFGARYDFGSTQFPGDDITALGVEAAYNAAGPLSVFGGLNVVSHDHDGESDSVNQFRIGAAFEVPALAAMMGPRISACPMVEARIVSENDATFMEIPLGLGIGGDLNFGTGPNLSAYVQPQIVFFRLSGDGATISENDFGITTGVMAGFGQVTVGGELRHIFDTGRDPVFGIRVGLRL